MSNSIDELVVIALGGNLPGEIYSPLANLERALAELPVEQLGLVDRSKWWRSAAWPDPSQPDYINGVAIVETHLSPQQVLAALHRIESRMGRVRGEANAARTVDLDLIAHGRIICDEPGLLLPHPRAADRLFVMGPLAEVAPDWRHPVSGRTASDLARSATVGADATPIVDR